MKPFFSVIIPVYKTEQYLHQCVNSILTQSEPDFEILLIDDGSPDSCPRLCDEIAKQNSNVRVIHQENQGVSAARNTGIEHARGEYLIFLDSDDYWNDPDGMKKIDSALRSSEADVLILRSSKYFSRNDSLCPPGPCPVEENVLYNGDRILELMRHNVFVSFAWDKVIKRSFVEEHDLRFVRGQLGEDIEWSSLILIHRPAITVLGTPIHVYRQQNEMSITSTVTRKNLVDIAGVIEKYVALAEKENNQLLLQFMAGQYVLWLTGSGSVPRAEQTDLLKGMKKYWYLLNYDVYPYVKKVKSVRFLGLDLIRKLLRMYRVWRKTHQ